MNYEEYKISWKNEIGIKSNMNTVEKGRLFSTELFTQYLDVSLLDDNLYYIDGKSDGGIDLAYLEKSENDDDEDTLQGDTWYIVQSKYGTSFQNSDTIYKEFRKLIKTLKEDNTNLSEKAQSFIDKITLFVNERADPDLDKVIILFATEDKLSIEHNNVINELRKDIKNKLGNIFDVKPISIYSIYEKLSDANNSIEDKIEVALKAKISNPNPEEGVFLAGSVNLLDLFDFLEEYERQTGDVNSIFDKNIRKFLRFRGQINKKIRTTLQKEPNNFGLYNNGITIIVSDWYNHKSGKSKRVLVNPYIVNGCQTTSTIWEVLNNFSREKVGGNKNDKDYWRKKFEKGAVMVKIAMVRRDHTVEKYCTFYK